MWDVFSFPDPRNKDEKWDLLLHKYIFPLDYLKLHVKSIKKDSETYQYVVQKLTCSGVYLMGTLSNIILQKVLPLVPLTETTMNTFFSYYNDALGGDSYPHEESRNKKLSRG